ncbi:ADP-ribose pyrophosphatase YjhB, NUDIX family [Agreia bicolorata]|uniref:ADP-ribose pyrophosphatase YjhB, NUDIX family n=1 Tax=Agreia bicolorata TaxID=110935 RepID=A0A1T4YCT2_9MICO|nr:NUDIX domain-containing protein [Agreia bicolorata]SKA99111.1 ADP-ribose pyrophosphatase YjhB, NUDIX family [Agreia bicolorata]
MATNPLDAAGRRPHGSGDAWVTAPDGRKFWGTFGAAGLLVHDDRGVLLQLRAEWSHHGGTWGLPGGARHEGESAVRGALREASEEAGVPADALVLEFTSVLDLGIWSYTTVGVRSTRAFEAVIGDAESAELRWVPIHEVDSLPLHPGFAARWPSLRTLVQQSISVVVDAANVVGSRPNGWWKDRAGAAANLLESLNRRADAGVPGTLLGLDVDIYWPSIVAVLEGQARNAHDPLAQNSARALADGIHAPVLMIDRTDGEGDDLIVEIADSRRRCGDTVLVVTADAGLRRRVESFGCVTKGTSWLTGILGGLSDGSI